MFGFNLDRRQETKGEQVIQRGFRPDIQALRAIAVMAVLVNHFWPDVLPGGYVGVDVFFVISGFLITSHLLEHPPRTFLDLARFWSRRLRRLLPAALVVIVVVLIASTLLYGPTFLSTVTRSALAATGYVLNWQLAADSVDYWAKGNSATPLQHYWSLSVEEQFYAVWPIMLLVIGSCAGRRARKVIPLALAVVIMVSFAASVHLTKVNPPAAYFVTHIRIWELGAGALLASLANSRWMEVLSRSPACREGLTVAGLAGITAACFAFSATTPFPGWAAALPVLGTVAVIAARPASYLMGWRPVQWVGDHSYAIYLWHWPVLLMGPAAWSFVHPSGSPGVGLLESAMLVIATLLLAGFTTRFIENPMRFALPRIRLRWTFVMTAVLMVVAGGLALSVQSIAVDRIAELRVEALRRAETDPCFGLNALRSSVSCPPNSYFRLFMAPEDASTDIPSAPVEPLCRSVAAPYWDPAGCATLETEGGGQTVLLAGDSHAWQLLPAFVRIAEQHHWSLYFFDVGLCNFGETEATTRMTSSDFKPTRSAFPEWTPEQMARNCAQMAPRIVKEVERVHPDVAVLAFTFAGYMDRETYIKAARRNLASLADAGIPTVVIHDNPNAFRRADIGTVPECLASRSRKHMNDCNLSLNEQTEHWLSAAADILASPLVRVANPWNTWCDGTSGVCPAVVGNVIALRDRDHITASFSATLAPDMEKSLWATGFFDRYSGETGVVSAKPANSRRNGTNRIEETQTPP